MGASAEKRQNGLLRRYIPKGVSIDRYPPEDVLSFCYEMNALPRKLLGLFTPEEFFDAFLDKVTQLREQGYLPLSRNRLRLAKVSLTASLTIATV